jgi:hypothetical protein
MRQGDSDRDIARSRLMGRPKAARLRELAVQRQWLDATRTLPDDAELAAAFAPTPLPTSCVSSLEVHRDRIAEWSQSGVAGTAIHAALAREHGSRRQLLGGARILQSIHASSESSR